MVPRADFQAESGGMEGRISVYAVLMLNPPPPMKSTALPVPELRQITNRELFRFGVAVTNRSVVPEKDQGLENEPSFQIME